MSNTIAVVAPGAMGAGIGARLHGRGARVLTSLDGRSEASRARAEAAGMEPATDDAIAAADLILSVVPPDQALPLARRLAGPLAARRSGTYVDLNAINPQTARSVGDALAASGVRYVDGGIIGLPPKPDGAGPTLYLAGEAADAAVLLEGYGLSVRTLPGGIGAASALKMSYAGITKGLVAVFTTMVLAAEREGAGAALADELGASQKDLLARLRKAVPDMLPKAYRWAPEMREIMAFVGEGPGRGIYESAAGLYEAVASDQALGEVLARFASPPP